MRFAPSALLASLALPALAVLASAPAPAAEEERSYSYQQFSQAFRGYLEMARAGDRNEVRAGTLRLYQLGVELDNLGVLRDATYGAIRLMDYTLAERIGKVWYQKGGGPEALALVASVMVSRAGLAESNPILRQLASEAGPDEVFEVVGRADGDKIAAYLDAHPEGLRGADYHAYLALLYLQARAWKSSHEVLNAGLEANPASLRLLFVRLLLALNLNAHVDSIATAEQLAQVADVDMLTTIGTVDNWRSQQRGQRLPEAADFVVPDGRSDLYGLRSGLFYLTGGDPEKALAELAKVQRNSPVWAETLTAQVTAYRLLNDDEQLLGLLAAELKGIALEFLPEIGVLYASELNRVEGPAAAYAYLAGITRIPANPNILYNKSLYAERIDKLDVAEEALRHYIRLRPDDAYGYNALGYLFADRNFNLAEGRELIERAMAITNAEVEKALSENRKELAQQIVTSSAAIIDSHGWVLYRLGDLAGAKEKLELSLQLMGEQPHAEVMAHYGEVLWELGEREAAVRVWRQAWQVDSSDRHLIGTLQRYGVERDN